MPQHPKNRLARMLWNREPTIEIDADVLEIYHSFTADINIDKTDKNIKQEEVFDPLINQLPPNNDIVYIDHDKKDNKFRVRQETSDKNATQKSLKKKLKRKAQDHVNHRLRKKSKNQKTKKSSKKPHHRKIGFTYKRTEKARKQRAEQKDEVVYLDTQPKHPRDRFRRKTKNKLKKEAEDEVIYLSTWPLHPRDRFRGRVKNKKWHK